MTFKNAEWIWENNEDRADEYASFLSDFEVKKMEQTFIDIASDSNYLLYINGKMASFLQYADYPNKKVFDHIDITSFLKVGKNVISVLVWYFGEGSSVYKKGDAGLIFEVYSSETVLCISNEKTISRIAPDYCNYKKETITGQLGFNFSYDRVNYDGYFEEDFQDFYKYHNSVIKKSISKNFQQRPVEKLFLLPKKEDTIVKMGTFLYADKERLSEKMYCGKQSEGGVKLETLANGNTLLKAENKAENIFFILDLKEEEAGYFNLELNLKENTLLDIAYGEHIVDGKVRSVILQRNFVFQYNGKKGLQNYVNYFRRLGLRYLQIFVHSDEIEFSYIGILPCRYPLSIEKFNAKNSLEQKIYDTSLRTLILCIHEHYEDCPWREQGLYVMDSRNQMLCGYYAFKEYKFAKANLELMMQGQGEDGLLDLCFPADIPITIPYFSLMFITALKEYIDYSGDKSILKQGLEVSEKILSAFKVDSNGLYPKLFGDRYWNFYEWKDGLDGYHFPELDYDAPLNAFISLALQNMKILYAYNAENEKAKDLDSKIDELNLAIFKNFFDKDKKIFKSFLKRGLHYSALTNSLCVLCGATPNEFKDDICDKLIYGFSWVQNTLSMNCFRYDALLSVNSEKYSSLILAEISKTYKKMLDSGATTFWETELGDKDFDNAGSLCHAWSALPVYYFNILKEYK